MKYLVQLDRYQCLPHQKIPVFLLALPPFPHRHLTIPSTSTSTSFFNTTSSTLRSSSNTSTTMAFVYRRPFALTTCLKQLPKATAPSTRAFHTSPKPLNLHSKILPTLSKSRNTFQQAFRRTYIQQPGQVVPPNTATLSQRLLYGAAIVGGTVLATNLIFNRETREDGGMPPFEREYLNQTFLHTGLGIGIIGITAQALHRSGWSVRLMTTNPWVVLGVGLAASIGTMYGTFATPPDKYAFPTSPLFPNTMTITKP